LCFPAESGSGCSDGTETAPAIVIVWPANRACGDRQRSENLALALKQMDAVEMESIESSVAFDFNDQPQASP